MKILLDIPDDGEALTLLEDARDYPDSPLLTPTQEHTVEFAIVGSQEGKVEFALEMLRLYAPERLAT